MGREKTDWYAKPVDSKTFPVGWSCLNPETRAPNGRFADHRTEWARLVTLQSELHRDGRRIVTVLTPEEARTVGQRLIDRANTIDASNRAHDNGWAPDAPEYVAKKDGAK